MGPMCRIETEHRRCSGPSATGFHGCATSSPMAAMRAANCAMPSRGMVTGPSRSSSDPTRPKALRCCRADGWSNARSPGSADADASPRTGRKPSKAPAPGPSSPASDSSHAGSQDIATQRKLLGRALRCRARPRLCREPPRVSHLFRAARGRGSDHRRPRSDEHSGHSARRLLGHLPATAGCLGRLPLRLPPGFHARRQAVHLHRRSVRPGSRPGPLDPSGQAHPRQPGRLRATGNPFVNRSGAKPEIWSYGHRNILGLAVHPGTAVLWEGEFGPRGGDEINIPEPGRNYGWPLVSWGDHYDGRKIPRPPTRPDLADAIYHWTPSISFSGIAFYTGDAFPAWRNNLLLAGLSSEALTRLSLDGARVMHEERIPMGERIRHVVSGPDGFVYLLTDEDRGRILRLKPADRRR